MSLSVAGSDDNRAAQGMQGRAVASISSRQSRLPFMRALARPCLPCLPATWSARSRPFNLPGPLLPADEPPVPTVEDEPILLPAVEPPAPIVDDVPALPLPRSEER